MTEPCPRFDTRIPYFSNANPLMEPEEVVQGDHWRVGVLTDSLIRLEWSETGEFEDRCSEVVVDRCFPPLPAGSVRCVDGGGWIVIETPKLKITYNKCRFSKEGLQILVKGLDGVSSVWHYGDVQERNLGGTVRTLDGADGAIPLGTGVASRDGWAVLDDSQVDAIEPLDEGTGCSSGLQAATAGCGGNANHRPARIVLREDKDALDLYFFGYGHDYPQAVHDFHHLTGSVPLLPRFVFGNWWSRFYKYTADQYLALMDGFKAEGIPFTTAVIDMDWHITEIDPKYGNGWTGYTWNRDLFPDPQRFLDQLHKRGLHTTLNLHPEDGVRAYEEAYPKVAKAVGVDAQHGEPVEFDLTNPRFVDAYLNMHHDLEDQGVDFWWLDLYGNVIKQPGIDSLWMLNHLHYLDSGHDGRWPLTFSRYGGPGSHRYPIGFSGDTIISWDSLRFQPYFTATASNIGYPWWSHDIGGHIFGFRDEELEARWFEFGVFSPINRLHSSNSPFSGKEPGNFHEPVRSTMVQMLRLRQALIPYLYTMNWHTAIEDRPLVEPMYWRSPEIDVAYEVPNEYRFGTELVVAPITEPTDCASMRGKTNVWLPKGLWFDAFAGRRYAVKEDDGRRFGAWRTIDGIPVFAKAGAIIPMSADRMTNDTDNPSAMSLLVFPGEDGDFTLREDDGDYPLNGRLDRMLVADTRIDFDFKRSVLTIHAPEGTDGIVPSDRHWTVTFRGVAPVPCVVVNGESYGHAQYDESTLSLTLQQPIDSGLQDIVIEFPQGLVLADNPVERDVYEILRDAQIAYPLKDEAYGLIQKQGLKALPALRTLEYIACGYSRLAGGPQCEDKRPNHIPQSVTSALEEVLNRA